MDLSLTSNQELQGLVDRARRELAERKLERQRKFKYGLDPSLIGGICYTKELKPCVNPKKCKRCCERHEYHGPVYKSYLWDGENKRMIAHSLGQTPPLGWVLYANLANVEVLSGIYTSALTAEAAGSNPARPFRNRPPRATERASR